MTIQTIFLWSKKIHRLAMWFSFVFGIPLTISGLILSNETLEIWSLENGYNSQVRFIHRATSDKFAIILATLMATGILMWGIPKLIAHRAKAGK